MITAKFCSQIIKTPKHPVFEIVIPSFQRTTIERPDQTTVPRPRTVSSSLLFLFALKREHLTRLHVWTRERPRKRFRHRAISRVNPVGDLELGIPISTHLCGNVSGEFVELGHHWLIRSFSRKLDLQFTRSLAKVQHNLPHSQPISRFNFQEGTHIYGPSWDRFAFSGTV